LLVSRSITRALLAGALVTTPASLVAQGGGAAPAARTARAAAQPIEVRLIGHASFEIVSSGGTRILIDPWLAQSPVAPDSLKSAARYAGATKPAAILVTHAHFDHAGDAKALAQASGATVVSAFEWASTLGLPEAQAVGVNVGGTVKIGDVTVHVVAAEHSSEPGRPLGFVLEFADGRTLYHTGDTGPFGDMALIQELYRPSIILLGVGGGPYTQDPRTAAVAVRKYFKPATIVPMHFGTFPALATEAQVRAAFPNDARLTVMKPGEARRF
jgi:L-ascorbate metabolism protein UlaG (beta-lactamase superfamily)